MNNVQGPGYVLMTGWIIEAFKTLSSEYLVESFKYCGITTSNISEYHSQLSELIKSPILPYNTTVDMRDETDEFGDVFVIDEDGENGVDVPSRPGSGADEDDDDDKVSDHELEVIQEEMNYESDDNDTPDEENKVNLLQRA